jgi:hypothetical protein
MSDGSGHPSEQPMMVVPSAKLNATATETFAFLASQLPIVLLDS